MKITKTWFKTEIEFNSDDENLLIRHVLEIDGHKKNVWFHFLAYLLRIFDK